MQSLQVTHSECVWPPGKDSNQTQAPILMNQRHENDGTDSELPARAGIFPGVQRRITAQLHGSAGNACSCKACSRVDHFANFGSKITRSGPANQLLLLLESNRGPGRVGCLKRLLGNFQKKMCWDTIEPRIADGAGAGPGSVACG
jgi:hypothetical protein